MTKGTQEKFYGGSNISAGLWRSQILTWRNLVCNHGVQHWCGGKVWLAEGQCKQQEEQAEARRHKCRRCIGEVLAVLLWVKGEHIRKEINREKDCQHGLGSLMTDIQRKLSLADGNNLSYKEVRHHVHTCAHFVLQQFISDGVCDCDLPILIYVCLYSQTHCLPDLFYNVFIFFDWQVHNDVYVLKPFQKVQSKHYGPGMLFLSSHGQWVITIAKCGILCIRDVYTLVNSLFF